MKNCPVLTFYFRDFTDVRRITLIILVLQVLCGAGVRAQQHTVVNLGKADSSASDSQYKIVISYYSPADKQHLDEFQQLISSYLDLYIDKCAMLENGDVKLRKSRRETLKELNNIVQGALEFYEYEPLKTFKSFTSNVDAKLESIDKMDFNRTGAAPSEENKEMRNFYFKREIESLKELVRMEVGIYASANVLMHDSSSEMVIDEGTKQKLLDQYATYDSNSTLEPIRIALSDSSQALIHFEDTSSLLPSDNVTNPNLPSGNSDFASEVLGLLKANNSKLDGMQKQIDDLRAEQLKLWQNSQDEKNMAMQNQINDLKEMVLALMNQTAGDPVVSNDKVSSPSRNNAPSVILNLPESINVYFARGSAILDANSKLTLNEVVDILARNPNLRIIITGFADKTGDPAKNLLLSQQRAGVVQKFISQSGLPSNRFYLNYFGDSESAGEKASDRKVVVGFVQ